MEPIGPVTEFLGRSFRFWAVLSLVIAAIYAFVWPKPRRGPNDTPPLPRPRWRHWILRWFHSLVWVFLALAAMIQEAAVPEPSGAARAVALIAFAFYITFLLVLALDRREAERSR